MDIEHYVATHGLLWIAFVGVLYVTGLVILASRAQVALQTGRTRTLVRRLGYGLAWVVAIPACMKAEDVHHARAVEPESLFHSHFDFPAPPTVRFLASQHADAFDFSGAYLELVADAATIERIIEGADLPPSAGAPSNYSGYPKGGRSEAVVCNGASRHFGTPDRAHSRHEGWLCVFDGSGRVFFAASSCC